MKLVPPRLFGPLSECSRSVRYDFAIPGATIIVMRTPAETIDLDDQPMQVRQVEAPM